MTNKGFTHWVVVALIGVIAIFLVGITWYYKNNKKNTNNTNKLATNTIINTTNVTNAANNTNTTKAVNAINATNTAGAPKTYTNNTFRLTLTVPTGATVYEGTLNYSNNLNGQSIEFRLPEDATYGSRTIYLNMNPITEGPGSVVGKTLEQFAQYYINDYSNLNLLPSTVTFNGISGIQYSKVSDTSIFYGTFFKDSNGNFAYLYTEQSAPGDINTGQFTTTFSESYKTKVQQEFNALRDSIKYSN